MGEKGEHKKEKKEGKAGSSVRRERRWDAEKKVEKTSDYTNDEHAISNILKGNVRWF